MDFSTMRNMMQASASAALVIATSASPTMSHIPYEKDADIQIKHGDWAKNDFSHIDLWRKASSRYAIFGQDASRRLSVPQHQLEPASSATGAAGGVETAGAAVMQPAKKLSNLEHFQLGSQFETEGNFAAACRHYSLAVAENTLPVSDGLTAATSSGNNASASNSGDVYLTYTTKLAIRKRVKWLEWVQETDAAKKKMLGLQYIHLLYLCRSDKINANDDLLGASHCLNSMGLLEEAKSCYEHYVNGVFEPSDKILTRCCTVPDDALQNMVERFQLNLDVFQVNTATDHEGMCVSVDETGYDAESDYNLAPSGSSTSVPQPTTKLGGSYTASSDENSNSSSGSGHKDGQPASSSSRRERSQPCTELGFDASACLLPLTPRRTVLSHDDAHSNDLRQFCYSHPVAVLRDMHAAVDMNLINYSTKAIVDVDADCPIEARTQLYQPSDVNLDLNTKKPTWDYYSEAGSTTVKNIALYQLQTFLQQNRTARAPQFGQPIHFGTNLDLSDTVKWHAQLDELDKLPSFLRVTADTNMLSYIDYELLGVNTVQMYIKVGGNRTPGHQENNNFCSVNVNIGPGDCEWFCVDFAHWEQVRDLCQKNDLDFLKDAWWPFTDDLTRAGVPVYKFIQKPGDVVWVNIGTVHWVQALSVCNNIAWNVGPLTAYQLKVGIERYEYNRIARFQSIIPMTYLIWSLAQSGAKVVNRNGGAKLFTMLKTLMRQSLEHCQLQLRMLECVFKKEVHLCDPTKVASNKRAQYCWRCESEVYNVLYCLRKQKARKIELETYCYRCAIADDSKLTTYTIMQQYDLKQLCEMYEKFRFDYGGGKNSIANAISSGLQANEDDDRAVVAATPSSSVLTNAAAPKHMFDAALQSYQQQQSAMSPVEHSSLLNARLTALAADAEKNVRSPTKKQRVLSNDATNIGPMRRSPAKMALCLPPSEAANGYSTPRMPVISHDGISHAISSSPSPSKSCNITNSPIIRSTNSNNVQKNTSKRTYETLCREYSMLPLRNDADGDEAAITAEMDGWHAKQTAAAEKRAAKGVIVKQRSPTKKAVKSQRTSPTNLIGNDSNNGRVSADYLNAASKSSSSVTNDVDDQIKRRKTSAAPRQRQKQSTKRERPDDDDDNADGDDEWPTTEADSTVDNHMLPTDAKPRKTAKRQYKRKRPNDADDADTSTADDFADGELHA